jgi:hypothetical protein
MLLQLLLCCLSSTLPAVFQILWCVLMTRCRLQPLGQPLLSGRCWARAAATRSCLTVQAPSLLPKSAQ